jgi:hypothetical protein
MTTDITVKELKILTPKKLEVIGMTYGDESQWKNKDAYDYILNYFQEDKIMTYITDQERVTKSYEKDFDQALSSGDKNQARRILRNWLRESERLDVMEDVYKAVRI